MIVIGLGKEGLIDGQKYNVGHVIGAALIKCGLAYKEGDEKPVDTPKKTTKRRPKKTEE